jgi:uncharacterized protein
MTRLPVTGTRDGARFHVHVRPGASRTAVTGVHGDGMDASLKVALQAPPVDGRANEALVEFLAELFHVRRAEVTIAAGQRARNKTVLIRGRSAADLCAVIDRILETHE